MHFFTKKVFYCIELKVKQCVMLHSSHPSKYVSKGCVNGLDYAKEKTVQKDEGQIGPNR